MTDKERHEAAAHAMQSGVAFEIESRGEAPAGASPKHLRTGVNAAMSDAAGLATLLIEKGIFTQEEYTKAVADSMEQEVARYEQHLTDQLGFPTKITLR